MIIGNSYEQPRKLLTPIDVGCYGGYYEYPAMVFGEVEALDACTTVEGMLILIDDILENEFRCHGYRFSYGVDDILFVDTIGGSGVTIDHIGAGDQCVVVYLKNEDEPFRSIPPYGLYGLKEEYSEITTRLMWLLRRDEDKFMRVCEKIRYRADLGHPKYLIYMLDLLRDGKVFTYDKQKITRYEQMLRA